MNILRDLRDKVVHRSRIIGEVIQFLGERKVYWLIPLILVLLAVAFVFFMASQPAVTPFVYTLF
jgi:hypothetical protein